MKKLLIFAILFAILTQVSYAKTQEKIKTVKFHKAETEAEKALDRVLMSRQHVTNDEYKDEEIFTKKFLYEAKKKYENCSYEEDGDVCIPYWKDLISGNGDYATDIGFLYYTVSYKMMSFRWDEDMKNGLIYIYALPRGHLSNNYHYGEEYDYNVRCIKENSYVMKQEDRKWKIDGICDIDFGINHGYCSQRYISDMIYKY